MHFGHHIIIQFLTSLYIHFLNNYLIACTAFLFNPLGVIYQLNIRSNILSVFPSDRGPFVRPYVITFDLHLMLYLHGRIMRIMT